MLNRNLSQMVGTGTQLASVYFFIENAVYMI